jgi:putative endonuclease
MGAFFVYIIQSEIDGSYYKGYSENPLLRLKRHNNGETHSTCHLCPWKLVYVETVATKTAALVREKNLKKATRERLRALISHPKNEVGLFI